MIRDLPKEMGELFNVIDEGVDPETITLKDITKLGDLETIANSLKLKVEYQSLKTNILADNAIQGGKDYSKLLEGQLEELKRLLEEKIDELTERESGLNEEIVAREREQSEARQALEEAQAKATQALQEKAKAEGRQELEQKLEEQQERVTQLQAQADKVALL